MSKTSYITDYLGVKATIYQDDRSFADYPIEKKDEVDSKIPLKHKRELSSDKSHYRVYYGKEQVGEMIEHIESVMRGKNDKHAIREVAPQEISKYIKESKNISSGEIWERYQLRLNVCRLLGSECSISWDVYYAVQKSIAYALNKDEWVLD